MALTFSKQLQHIVTEYIEAKQPWPASTHEIAAWAIRQGRWKPQHSDMVDQCANQLSRAMREEYMR